MFFIFFGLVVFFLFQFSIPVSADSFLYDGTTWTTLNYPGGGQTDVQGIDGNNIVGHCVDGGFLYDGTTWTLLNYPGGTFTAAYGIDGNNIVGICADSDGRYGFVYDGITWTTLNYPGSEYTVFHGIDGNNIVGEHSNYSPVSRGFVYDGITWTPLDNPWGDVTIPLGISGNNIVGVFDKSNVPTPGTLLLVGSGLIGLAGLRRKFRTR